MILFDIMKKMTTILLFTYLFFNCSNQATNNIKNSEPYDKINSQESLVEKEKKIKNAYYMLTVSKNKEYDKEYFEVFPNSFTSFVELFGNRGSNDTLLKFDPGPLYNESHLYINEFFNLSTIDKNDYSNKVFDLCIGGIWDADAVNILKHNIQRYVKKNLNIFCELMSKRSNSEVKSFWHFYFDGPHSPNKLPEELETIKTINKQIYTLMQEALKEVQNERDH